MFLWLTFRSTPFGSHHQFYSSQDRSQDKMCLLGNWSTRRSISWNVQHYGFITPNIRSWTSCNVRNCTWITCRFAPFSILAPNCTLCRGEYKFGIGDANIMTIKNRTFWPRQNRAFRALISVFRDSPESTSFSLKPGVIRCLSDMVKLLLPV